jgi:hypothetical protein
MKENILMIAPFKNRIEVIHPRYGNLPYINWVDLDTMQGEEYNFKRKIIHSVDLSECTIIIKPLK